LCYDLSLPGILIQIKSQSDGGINDPKKGHRFIITGNSALQFAPAGQQSGGF